MYTIPIEFRKDFCRKDFLLNILTLNIHGNYIQSALFSGEESAPSLFREVLWNDGLGFSELVRKLRGIVSVYPEYQCIGVCVPEMEFLEYGNYRLDTLDLIETNYLPLRAVLEDIAKVPVYLERRVNAISLAESRLGAGKGYTYQLYTHFSTKVSGSIALQRQLYRGKKGLAGEIGHMVLYAGGQPCYCGRKGCYERYASVKTLVDRASKIDAEITNGVKLMQAVTAGNLSARAVLHRWIADVAAGVANGIYLLDPQVVILGGGICREDYIFERIREEVYTYLLPPYHHVRIGRATLGREAAMQGISIIAREEHNKGRNGL